jgi:hypothetical protein
MQDKGGKAINRPYLRSNYNLEIKHWSDRCEEDECANRDTSVQRSKKNDNMGMR